MTTSGRLPAAVTLGVLLVALVVLIVVLTPWNPLPGKHVPVDVARDFTPAEHAREDAFHSAVRPPAYVSLALGVAVALVLGLTSWGARLIEAVARPVGGGWVARAALGAVALVLLTTVVTLLPDARAETVRRDYGLSTQTWASWFTDRGKSLAISAVIFVVIAVLAYLAVRAWPRGWWAAVATGVAGMVMLLSFVLPVVIEPVFNKFTPLPAGELRTSLLAMAERDGVRVDDVLVADASRRTNALNAYVSGYGATRRIVVYDTLLETATPAEVRLVVAHELGHAKRNDVLVGTAMGAVAGAAAVCALFLLTSWAPLLRRAGVESVRDPRSLALMLALVTVGLTLFSPIANLVSRRVEARADVHSLDLTRDPTAFIRSERTLQVRNLGELDSHPVLYALFATHPRGPERIAIARTWAQQNGVPDPPPLAP